jgi:hypothetical protein
MLPCSPTKVSACSDSTLTVMIGSSGSSVTMGINRPVTLNT